MARGRSTLMEVKPELTGERLINGLGDNSGPNLTRAGFTPENYRRLVELKDTYDPKNVFRFNYNVAPSNS